jgi:hypothetical protein
MSGARSSERGPLMRLSCFQPSFITPSGGVRKGKSLDHIRITPLFVHRPVPQNNADQARQQIDAPDSTIASRSVVAEGRRFAGLNQRADCC